jgi:ribosome biogenesis GTPase
LILCQSEGIVIQASSGLFQVETDCGVIECMARAGADPGAIVLGDRVLVSPQPAGRGIIESSMPRKTRFSRKVAGRRQDEQVIAANLDQVVIVLAAAEPPFKETTLDRYLAAVEHYGLDAVVCINKIDLASTSNPVSAPDLVGRAEVYTRIGYMVIMTSATTGSGIDPLRQALEGRVSALVGPSGAGKSSLVCAVSPGVSLDTGEISASTGKGRHTTTCSRLIKLDSGGYVADTPGMREFGFHQISRDELAWCFKEFRAHAESCKFADCKHIKEPGCGVRKAAEQGLVSHRRYEHYLRLMGGVSPGNHIVVC